MKSYSPVALAVAAAVLAGTASAQDVTALEEIVVTATKREQTLQDVPVAVTVTPVETIQKASIQDITDLASIVTSLALGVPRVLVSSLVARHRVGVHGVRRGS
jgi:iron complex outermembrane receptor protein